METKKDRYIIKEVPTEMGLVVSDEKTNENITQLDLMVKIVNILNRLEEGLLGK